MRTAGLSECGALAFTGPRHPALPSLHERCPTAARGNGRGAVVKTSPLRERSLDDQAASRLDVPFLQPAGANEVPAGGSVAKAILAL